MAARHPSCCYAIRHLFPRSLQFLTLLHFNMLFYGSSGVAQWIECQPVNQRVAGSIPSQGTCLNCGPGPLVGGV